MTYWLCNEVSGKRREDRRGELNPASNIYTVADIARAIAEAGKGITK